MIVQTLRGFKLESVKFYKNKGFGEAPAVQFRDMAEGAALVACLLFTLFKTLLLTPKVEQKEEVKMNQLQKTISKVLSIVPVVKLSGMIVYLGYVIQSWVKTGLLPIHN